MLRKFFTNIYSNNKQKMVLIVRTDIKMGTGKLASQCAHAAVSLATKSPKVPLKFWLLSGQPKIVLKVQDDSEKILNKLYEIGKTNNLNVVLIHDAGKTQIESGTLTVLGIGPNNSEDIDKLTKNLKLL